MEVTQIVVAVLSLAGVALGGIATYRSAIRGKEIEAEATPYEALSRRVTELETADDVKGRRISRLERRFRIIADALAVQHRWQLAGAKPPPPTIPPLAIEIITREDTDDDHQ